MEQYIHSVVLDEKKCKGCTNCIKRCPTEAIRVRKSKARIITERCIDCGECIRVCPYHAKMAYSDSLAGMEKFKYKIAIPAPTLYGQFKSRFSRNHILTALKMLGFDEVFEAARAAELVSQATKKLLESKDVKKPLISSACPAVVRLIQVRFPNLIENIIKIESPMELAARIVKTEAIKKGIPEEDIGICFISPCAAKVTAVKASFEKTKSLVDVVVSIKDIYSEIFGNLMKIRSQEDVVRAGFEGIRWANSGGESLALGTEKFLAVDGIHNVITILEEVENDRLEDVEFIETLACNGGCLGGPLTVENVYVAKTRLKKHIDDAKKESDQDKYKYVEDQALSDISWTSEVKYRPILKLDEDIKKAMKMMDDMNLIKEDLPDLDCGACGAPSCRALAEDIVRGNANETDCIFKLREKVRNLAVQMMELEAKMPPVLDKSSQQDEV
jgi:iron only hydrogenase large subunit-like protein